MRKGSTRRHARSIVRVPALVALALVAGAEIASAQQPPCQPCVGIRVDDPRLLAERLARQPRLEADDRLYVAWEVPANDDTGIDAIREVAASGATPWPIVRFETSAPLLENLPRLEAELARLARIVDAAGPTVHVQIEWRPAGRGITAELIADYAFLLKRAAVAATGARQSARVIAGPLPPGSRILQALYSEDVAAYVDGVAFTAPQGPSPLDDPALAEAIEVLGQLDPGRPVVLDHLALPNPAELALARAAEASARGIDVTFFAAGSDADLAPLELMARRFSGDVSLDPYSVPTGVRAAWSFVRGEDLSLQILAEVDEGVDEVTLTFTEPHLRDARRVLPSGEEIPLLGLRRRADGLDLTIADPDRVTLIELARLTAAEIEGITGVEERVTVESERYMPVSEILRRLQAFEDAQARRLDTYTATNTLSLRLQGSGGTQPVDITFQGDFFFRQGEGFDWAWQRLFVNGVRWRRNRVPEIPLVQPEKASSMPAEITFTREYVYRLRGTETVDGRDCWVVDFEPAVEPTPERSLYQGTVWIDREIYARVKSRTLQLGLTGDVVSNDETIHFEPVASDGSGAPWSEESFVLPLHTVGQQIFSLFNAAVVVEREVTLTDIRINPDRFDERLAAAHASEATMLRDTEEGLRYLVPDEQTGERVVQEELDPNRLFVVGGVFYDESQDFPLPLAGVNWLSFDYRGTGAQANVFFGGVLLVANLSTPSLFGSRWEAGVDAFALAFAGTDTLYRDGREVPSEDVERLRPNIDLTIGRPLGNFAKLQLEYSLGWNNFASADDTAAEFVTPSDHLDHRVLLRGRYNRSGYRLRANAGFTRRGEWEAWGLPANPDFDPDKEEYTTWGAGLAKIWHLPHFLKFGAEVEYVGGDDLDRFSKYQFGPFSDIRVRGYRSELIRAEEAWATHLSYGFNFGELFQLQILGDVAWATDDATGLDRELLGGVGVAGTFVGPWSTVINLDVGKAVAGPDDSFTVLLAVLKLFD